MNRSEKLAGKVRDWQLRLAPRLPEIDPHDLHLILWAMLRRKHGGHIRFLVRRQRGGGYVF